jgi:hypothetical protein
MHAVGCAITEWVSSEFRQRAILAPRCASFEAIAACAPPAKPA